MQDICNRLANPAPLAPLIRPGQGRIRWPAARPIRQLPQAIRQAAASGC